MGRRDKKKKSLKLRNIILLILALYIGKTFLGQGKLIKDLENKRSKEEQEIGQLEDEIRELKDEIKIKGSLSFVEKVARDDLGMVKPREIIYIDKNKNKNSFMKFRK